MSVPGTLRGKADVHGCNILLQQSIETAGPRLADAVSAELGDERRGVVVAHTTQRPTREVDVHVDQFIRRRRRLWRRRRFGFERREGGDSDSSLEKVAPVDGRSFVARFTFLKAPLLASFNTKDLAGRDAGAPRPVRVSL